MRCRLAPVLLACVAGLAAPALEVAQAVPPAQAKVQPEAILSQARDAYVGLAARGFRGYRSIVTPDWPLTLAELAKTNPDGYEAALKLLQQIRYEVRVGAHGQSQITHTFVDTPNQGTTTGLNQVNQGVEQAVNGFFQTWAPLMVHSPIPPKEVPCKAEDQGSHFQLNWEEAGGVRVDLRLDRAFTVTEMKVLAPAFHAAIRPTFERQSGAFVLCGYDADFTPQNGGAAMTLKVLIQNQLLDGLPLPAHLDVTVWTQGRKERMTFAFTELKAEAKGSGQ
ncbi:MAG: hypothetical protein U0P46_03875 [Holophagaceae bacterium]